MVVIEFKHLACKMHGRRNYMEDRYLISEYKESESALYLALDGHVFAKKLNFGKHCLLNKQFSYFSKTL